MLYYPRIKSCDRYLLITDYLLSQKEEQTINARKLGTGECAYLVRSELEISQLYIFIAERLNPEKAFTIFEIKDKKLVY